MDFYFPHVYFTAMKDYEDAGVTGNHHNFSAIMDRINMQLYWFKNNSPVPWMVGEAGLNAFDTVPYISPFCVSPCCNTNACDTPVYNSSSATWNGNLFHGDESDQQLYFNNSLSMTRNCGGQGFSVWDYQDGFSNTFNENFGLLHHGDTDSSNLANLLKPAAAEFTNYLDANGQPPDPVPLAAPPNNYYDPMHTAYYLSLGCPGCNIIPVTGTVTDTNGNPIKDALLVAHTVMEFDPAALVNNIFIPIDNVFYTFTQVDGTFSLTPFDPEHQSDTSRQYIRWLEITSIGSANSPGVYPYNCWGCFTHNINVFPPSVGSNLNCSLNKIDMNLNDTIQNQTVNSGNSPKTFEAWRTLNVTTSNTVQSGGTADFRALDEVNVEHEFHAENGSEVHIYNTTVQLKCSDITDQGGFRMTEHSEPPFFQPEKALELIFKKKNWFEFVSIYPNPNKGIFTVNYSGNDNEAKQLKVYDIIGNIIFNSNFTGNETEINLSEFPKGIYFFEVKSKIMVINQKIITQ